MIKLDCGRFHLRISPWFVTLFVYLNVGAVPAGSIQEQLQRGDTVAVCIGVGGQPAKRIPRLKSRISRLQSQLPDHSGRKERRESGAMRPVPRTLHSVMPERLFDDPDFRYFNEGTKAKAECTYCGAVMWAIEVEAHRQQCPMRPKTR